MKVEIDVVKLAEVLLPPQTYAKIKRGSERAAEELRGIADGLEATAGAAPFLLKLAATIRGKLDTEGSCDTDRRRK